MWLLSRVRHERGERSNHHSNLTQPAREARKKRKLEYEKTKGDFREVVRWKWGKSERDGQRESQNSHAELRGLWAVEFGAKIKSLYQATWRKISGKLERLSATDPQPKRGLCTHTRYDLIRSSLWPFVRDASCWCVMWGFFWVLYIASLNTGKRCSIK